MSSCALPVYKPGYFGVYDALSDRKSKSSRDKFREDKIILLRILPEFCVFASGRGRMPVEDEMSRGVHDMIKQREKPFWLVFAAQIFLDIHHTLRDHVEVGFKDLVLSARYVENSIRQVMKFHNNLRIDTWPKSNDKALLRILELIEGWVTGDAVQTARAKLGSNLLPSEPFLFLKNHPLFCGLLSYNIKISAQEVSVVFINAWGSVLYCAHLYNALRQEKLISNAWQDMDLALLMHRTEDMFVGDFPKTIEDYFKRFTLAMGYSASMFAKNRRKKGIVASKAGLRSLNVISPISRMFMSRYCDNDGRTDLSLEDVDTILEKYTEGEDDTDSNELSEQTTTKTTINLLKDRSLKSHSNGTGTSRSHKRRDKTQRSATTGVYPVQLLNAVLEAIQSEMLELSFDHFRLHIFSWCLLREIKRELDTDIRNIYGPMYLEKRNQLPFVVGYIFMTAVGSSKLAGVLVPKMKDVVTSRLLVKAADIVRKILETGAGGIEVAMLKKHFGFEVEAPDFLELTKSRI